MTRWFVSLKAYGDLVIACHHLRHSKAASDVLLCGEHLRPLLVALKYKGNVAWLATGENGVPSFFDMRLRGVRAALRSGLHLRNQLRKNSEEGDFLVFDSLGWKQKVLAGSCQRQQIANGQPNIYLDYERFLGLELPESMFRGVTRPLRIGVFPDSRIATKALPDDLLNQIVNVVDLAGNSAQVLRAGPGLVVDGFESLIRHINACDAIISADSLPAHIAEYCGKPVFVFSPRPNPYWLPKTAFIQQWHELFSGTMGRLSIWLETI